MDDLGLVEAVDGLGQSVVVAVADAAHRWLDTGFCQAFSVFDRHVLASPVAVVHQPGDLWHQPGITLYPCRQPRRIGPPGGMGVIGRWGNRQHLADRLDPIRPALIVDERDHGLCRRSSSAWAKYADALRRISLACRSSRFSRSSAFSRAAISVVTPGARPLSRSAFLCN